MPDETLLRPRKTKLEKIVELEARLKQSEEENRLLRKAMHKLKSGSSHIDHFSDTKQDVDSMDVERMKTVLKSLKRVTVKQEMMMQSMRESANDRRKQLHEKDEKITRLKQQLRSMEKSIKSMEKAEPGASLQRRIRDLESKYFDEKHKNSDLRHNLEQVECKARHLEKKMVVHEKNFSTSSRSIASGSSDNDNNMMPRLKQELAKKSSRIVALEYELETTKDELLELRHQTTGNTSNLSLCNSFQNSFHNSFHASFTVGEDGFPTAPPIGSDPFKATDPFLSMCDDDNPFSSSGGDSEYEDSQ